MKRLIVPVVVLIALPACGGDTARTSTTAATTTTGTPSAVTTTTTPATTGPTTTTLQVTSTSRAAATTTTSAASEMFLADGRPATFLAVTDDYQAVEVDTVTGEIVHIFGQTGSRAEVDAAEEMWPNVLVGIWRVDDGSMIGLSDCCEPAAGQLFFLASDDTLDDDPYSAGAPWSQGWTLTPSPVDNRFASLGYSLEIFDPAAPDEDSFGVWIDEPSLGFPGGAAAWGRDGSRLYWIAGTGAETVLAMLSLSDGTSELVGPLPWVGENQYVDGIGTQASRNLVGFLHTAGDDFEVVESSGVVFSTSGELLASFPVEVNSLWGGYDRSGRHLIYVDGDGRVRWQGLGQTGSLGEGFIFASW